MSNSDIKNKIVLIILGALAFGFGIMTIKSGSFALFGGVAGKEFAGQYIPLVLWFNFMAGFFYTITGVGIVLNKSWAVSLAKALALSTALVFIIFGVLVMSGTDYETKTVAAMTVRTLFWFLIFLASNKLISKN
jgi:hypothetical protein